MKISKPKLAVVMMKQGISTLEQLADRLNVTKQNVSAMLNRNCRINTLQNVAKALGCEVTDIVED